MGHIRPRFRLVFFAQVLMACAGGLKEQSRGEVAPCSNCGQPGSIQWSVRIDRSALELSSAGASGIVGIIPPSASPILTLETFESDCNYCHSFAAEPVAFDFANYENAVISKFSDEHPVLLQPGVQVPDADSLLWRQWIDSLVRIPFLDNEVLISKKPWQLRETIQQIIERQVGNAMRTHMAWAAARWNVDYIAITPFLQVSMQPKWGRSGGFRWDSLWILFDARQGKPIFIHRCQMDVETTGSLPPDRQWSQPCLQQALAFLQQQ